MKKITKFFTLLLTLTLILSTVAVSVFAKSESEELEIVYENQLKPSDATNFFACADASKEFGITYNLHPAA